MTANFQNKEDVSLFPGGKSEEAGPHRRSSGYKSPEDGKAAKGLRPTKAWSRPLRCPDSCATAVATGVESPDAEGFHTLDSVTENVPELSSNHTELLAKDQEQSKNALECSTIDPEHSRRIEANIKAAETNK
ncbi:hypothetical protein RF11_15762 [Thelohanellus kitauei]|uniref:Uncharacterized protein n=1 Tax=Thelohanellus kitauei TaxID=669202 RepID=A0A0C2IDB4_THEKT|nr:hypothetical protein RF11_15762 [Thelohanellus kitauei]